MIIAKTLRKRAAFTVVGLVLAVLLAASVWAYVQLRASLPTLQGSIAAVGLIGTVSISRDKQGVPTLVGRTRADLAFALGYLHAQERFFQMDGQRRTAAGEMSELVGPIALKLDRSYRLHRFRSRAAALIATMPADERVMLNAYTAGVNAGLGNLGARPFEYWLLRSAPQPWTPEDTVLTAYSIYLTLQQPLGATERWRADAVSALGQELAAFLLPEGTSWDAPLDGSPVPLPEFPSAPVRRAAGPQSYGAVEPPMLGSNAFAVSGRLTSGGGAIVANDMHLGLRVPNIWYRARLIIEASGEPALDITGITLPGTPAVIAGSNGRVAWGFTNSYVDTGDVVVLEPVEGSPARYRTPEGAKELIRVEEHLCRSCSPIETIIVEESIWGPVVGTDRQGRKLVYRWIAHDPIAVNLNAMFELERASSAREALDVAHRLGIPHQNLVAGDRDGNLGWTVTTALPRRFGHDGRLPSSWADGTRGWNGYLPPEEVPVVHNPEGQRLWSANARMVGGESLARLGFGGYAHGARARQIRDRLFASERFTETDLLDIQLDDRGLLLQRWQGLLLDSLRSQSQRRDFGALIPFVENWGVRAAPETVGYRLVRTFRIELLSAVYSAYMADLSALESTNRGPRQLPTTQADEPVWRLVSERPKHLVPPGYGDWNAVVEAALSRTLSVVQTAAGGNVDEFTWGAANRAAIRHPLGQVVPGLALVLDPPDEPQPGDLYQPRVAAPSMGASVRFVVSPGKEKSGLFHMPTSQTAHPLSPYYLVGHEDWAEGRPTPFLPSETKWQFVLQPVNPP